MTWRRTLTLGLLGLLGVVGSVLLGCGPNGRGGGAEQAELDVRLAALEATQDEFRRRADRIEQQLGQLLVARETERVDPETDVVTPVETGVETAGATTGNDADAEAIAALRVDIASLRAGLAALEVRVGAALRPSASGSAGPGAGDGASTAPAGLLERLAAEVRQLRLDLNRLEMQGGGDGDDDAGFRTD